MELTSYVWPTVQGISRAWMQASATTTLLASPTNVSPVNLPAENTKFVTRQLPKVDRSWMVTFSWNTTLIHNLQTLQMWMRSNVQSERDLEPPPLNFYEFLKMTAMELQLDHIKPSPSPSPKLFWLLSLEWLTNFEHVVRSLRIRFLVSNLRSTPNYTPLECKCPF